MSAELEQVTLAVAAITKVEAGLAALRETYSGVVYDVKTSEGMELARVARRAIREPRFEVERIRKAAKAPILALGKQLDAEAARITRELTLIEAPIDAVITAEEKRKEDEKEARIAAELARTEEIQRRIDWMRNRPVHAAGKSSADIAQMIEALDGYQVDDTIFQERLDDAKGVLEVSRTALRGLHSAALDTEAKAEQLKRDQEELAKLRAAEEERQRVAAAQRAIEEAAAKAEREDAAARQAVANRLERERIAREEADAKAIRDAERARQDAIDKAIRERNEAALQEIQAIHHQLIIADTGRAPYCKGGDLESIDWAIDGTVKWELSEERFGVLYGAAVKTKENTLAALQAKRVGFINRQENAAEAARLAEKQAEIERQQEALRVSKLPPARKPKHSPGAEAITDAVASHFGVDITVARRWLREVDWETVAA